jgi:hypothetical protein
VNKKEKESKKGVKVGNELSEGEKAYIEDLNRKIKEFNETSVSLIDGYLNIR